MYIYQYIHTKHTTASIYDRHPINLVKSTSRCNTEALISLFHYAYASNTSQLYYYWLYSPSCVQCTQRGRCRGKGYIDLAVISALLRRCQSRTPHLVNTTYPRDMMGIVNSREISAISLFKLNAGILYRVFSVRQCTSYTIHDYHYI